MPILVLDQLLKGITSYRLMDKNPDSRKANPGAFSHPSGPVNRYSPDFTHIDHLLQHSSFNFYHVRKIDGLFHAGFRLGE